VRSTVEWPYDRARGMSALIFSSFGNRGRPVRYRASNGGLTGHKAPLPILLNGRRTPLRWRCRTQSKDHALSLAVGGDCPTGCRFDNCPSVGSRTFKYTSTQVREDSRVSRASSVTSRASK
jgi:hypothetical protein